MMIPRQWTAQLGDRRLSALVIVLASVIAIGSARTYPTSWSDHSRLATVESLVDYGTLAIDRSVFQDTKDKVFIDGRFYSHKPPVPSLLMAAVYQVLQWTTGLRAREKPGRFYGLMTIGSAGVAYVIAVWCVFQIGRRLGLPRSRRLMLTASFATATLALPYTRAVNEHILLLAVASVIVLRLAAFASAVARGRSWQYVLTVGFLAGLGYALESGAGFPLMVSVLGLVWYRSRSPASIAVFLLGAVPWMALHHGLNYSIGGTFVPVAMVPEFFNWSGSPFINTRELTGAWNHETAGDFLIYAIGLLVGERGFILHNLPLWVAVAGVAWLLRRSTPERPEIVCMVIWSLSTWLLYAALSTNYSGWAVSIRWFVPLLAAGFYVLALCLRESPDLRRDVAVLTALGALWTFVLWRKGPWTAPPSMNWAFVALAVVSWCACRLAWPRPAAFRLSRRRSTT